ncbi:MAG TPA: hypoxanthine-guanine phosphoribosyltransferase [Accumulibacter sp.]|nr:hypoxanthine-guanine phosphoribosyltransferase [Accumulibacter sp.]
MIDGQQATCILAAADLLHSAETVAVAISRVARRITETLRDSRPVVLCVMNGGVPFAGQLLTQLNFPLEFDFLQVGRYGQATAGSDLSWRVEPSLPLAGRTVLVVDDILDEGVTLAAIRERVVQLGARTCWTAVLADKLNGREKPVRADFVALTVPDRFVFGYGMDVRGAWRNLPAIYAMRED